MANAVELGGARLAVQDNGDGTQSLKVNIGAVSGGGLLSESDFDTKAGALTETAPATDTASSGLNGRLQRVAQRLTSILAVLPASLGTKTAALSLPVTLASDGTFATLVGEVQASPTTNTVLDRLKALLTGIVLATGSNIVGRVGIDQTTPGTTDSVSTKTKGYAASVSVTRTNDTNGYTANDVLGPATGSTAALTFANMGSGAGEIIITSASLERDATALASGETSYTLHLYSVTPPSALGDNAAFDLPSGDRASYLGAIALGTPVDLGSTLFIATDGINKQLTLASSSLFGYLVTVAAYTPVAQAVHVVKLHAVGV